MRLQQTHVLAQRPQLVLETDCDFGVEPHPDTHRSLELILHDGKWIPVLILTYEESIKRIEFDCSFERGNSRSLREATVSFAQQDPTCPEVYVIVCYEGVHLEREYLTEDLRPYLDFWFEDGLNLDGGDESETDEEFGEPYQAFT